MHQKEKKNYYITTAIPYASKKPHIGNTYEIILTDAIARFKKMNNFNVCFCTGVDEHGQKIEKLAKEKGITPKEYSKNISDIIKKIWDEMNCKYDIFIRTTDEYHVQTVKKIFKKLYNQGDIYKDSYEGWYCTPCESFWTDKQLIENKCPECNREVEKTKETAYFLKVGKYQDKLLKHMQENKNFIVPNFYVDEIINNFLKPGLLDFCISRNNFKWGVSIDSDPEFVIYVWLDALINYITAIEYDPDLQNKQNKNFTDFWPADLQIVGKDILRFHTTIWPIILMMLDIPLPKQILVHQWLLYKENKMSKSFGNVVYADDLAKFFSVDTIRFYVLKAMSLEHDGSISFENIISVYNIELANTIGNLLKRVCDMICKYFNGYIKNSYSDLENHLENLAIDTFKEYKNLMNSFEISNAILKISQFARECNKYIDETTPWIIAKDENKKEELEKILFNLAISIRYIGVMLLPIIPYSANEILKQIGVSEENITFEYLKKFSEFKEIKIEKSRILFQRIDSEAKLKEIENSL